MCLWTIDFILNEENRERKVNLILIWSNGWGGKAVDLSQSVSYVGIK